jgi:hypothetical protein
MGTWVINVQGHGVHDNGLDHDAEQRLKQFVEQLRTDGHEILDATITVGGIRTVLQDPENEGKTILGYRQ